MKPNQLVILCIAMALLTVSCQTPPAQTSPARPPVAATPGSQAATPPEEPMQVGGATAQAAMAQFRGPDECQSGPEFELSYAHDEWNLLDTLLVNRAFPDCTLQLAAHGQQVTGPKVEQSKDLAGYSWQMSQFPNEGLSSYWLEVEGGCYLFAAQYSAQASAETMDQCVQAAESVISSFRLVGQ